MLTIAIAHGNHDKNYDPSSRIKWTRFYPGLAGQQWNSVMLDEHDGYLYVTGKIETSSHSNIPCVHEEASNMDGQESSLGANGLVCKFELTNGDVKWCTRSCDTNVPLFSSLSIGKDLVYVTGDKGDDNVSVLGIHKYSALSRMERILEGVRHSKTAFTKDGTLVCSTMVNEQGSTGLHVGFVTKHGFEIWSREIIMHGLKRCLGIVGTRNRRSVTVLAGFEHGSKNNSLVVIKMNGNYGDIIWQTTLNERNYSLTYGEVLISREGVFVASTEEQADKTLHVYVQKLGLHTGLQLWSKGGQEVTGLGAMSLHGRHEVVVGSFKNGEVFFNVFGRYIAESLLGEGEHERVEPSGESTGVEGIMHSDMCIGKVNSAFMRETVKGEKMIGVSPLVVNEEKRTENISSDVRVRVRANLIVNVPESEKIRVEKGIGEVTADAIKGRARMKRGILLANGRLTKAEATAIIKVILEDRAVDGRSYMERKLDLNKQAVLIHGNIAVLEARALRTEDQKRDRGKQNIGSASAGNARSLNAEVAGKPGNWAWWKVVTMTLGLLGLVGLLMFVALRK